MPQLTLDAKLADIEIASRQTSPETAYLQGTLPDPDVILQNTGLTTYIYRSLLTDPHISSVFQTRFSGIQKLEYVLEPAPNSGRSGKQGLKYIEGMLERLDVPRTTEGFLWSIPYGFSPNEIMYEMIGGAWEIIDVVYKPPEYFTFDVDGNLRYMAINGGAYGVLCPDWKFVTVKHRATYGNPYGDRLLSKCYWPGWFKKNGLKIWPTFLERYAMPLMIGKYPDGTLVEAQNAFMAELSGLMRNARGIMPASHDITLLDSGNRSGSTDAYLQFVEFCNKEISKVVIGQTLTTDIGSVGSFAASKTHSDQKQDVIDADKWLVAGGWKRLFEIYLHQVRRLDVPAPRFVFVEEQDPQNEFVQRDKVLFDMGLRFKPEYYQRRYGFEPEDFEIKEPEPPQPFGLGMNPFDRIGRGSNPEPKPEEPKPDEPKDEPKAEFSVKRSTRGLGIIAPLAIPAASMAGNAWRDLVGEILAAVDKTESLQCLSGSLPALYTKLNDKKIADALAISRFIAATFARCTTPSNRRATFSTWDDIDKLLSRKPEDIIKYFDSKGYKISWNWYDTWQEEHNRAFTVAHCTKLDVLQDIRNAIGEAIDKGDSFTAFRQNLEPTLQAKGWWGEVTGLNPKTGLPELYTAGTPERLVTIFDTNMSVAFSAARYKQDRENIDVCPYWQYSAVMDEATRPEHALLNEQTYRADDPIWSIIYPPSDWGCRCEVFPLDASQLEEMGLVVMDGGDIDPSIIESIPEEWRFNPGETAWEPDKGNYDNDLWGAYQS